MVWPKKKKRERNKNKTKNPRYVCAEVSELMSLYKAVTYFHEISLRGILFQYFFGNSGIRDSDLGTRDGRTEENKWKKENQSMECSQVGHDQRQLGQGPLGPLKRPQNCESKG